MAEEAEDDDDPHMQIGNAIGQVARRCAHMEGAAERGVLDVLAEARKAAKTFDGASARFVSSLFVDMLAGFVEGWDEASDELEIEREERMGEFIAQLDREFPPDGGVVVQLFGPSRDRRG